MLSQLAQSDPLKFAQVVLSLTVAFSVLAIVLELVRRQKLREEYAILWIATSAVLITLALSTRSLQWLANALEADSLVSVLYFGALLFLLLVALQFSVRLTKLTFRTKTAHQRIALLEADIHELRQAMADEKKGHAPDTQAQPDTVAPSDTVAQSDTAQPDNATETDTKHPEIHVPPDRTETLRPGVQKDPVS